MNRVKITRLDAEGNPVGEPITLDGFVSLNAPPEDNEVEFVRPTTTRRLSLTITMCAPDLDVVALTFGLKPWPRWWRLLPKRLRDRLKTRRIRKLYGG